MKEFLQSRNLLSREDVPFKKQTQSHKFYSPWHKWAQDATETERSTLTFLSGLVSCVGKNGGMVGVAGGRDNILN